MLRAWKTGAAVALARVTNASGDQPVHELASSDPSAVVETYKMVELIMHAASRAAVNDTDVVLHPI